MVARRRKEIEGRDSTIRRTWLDGGVIVFKRRESIMNLSSLKYDFERIRI